MVLRKNPAHQVLVDFQAEGVRNLLGNAGAAEARIEALYLEDCGNQFLRRSLGAGASRGLRGRQPLILSSDKCSMKSQQRRGPDGDRDFQYALRRHEHSAQAQQDTVQGAQLRCRLRFVPSGSRPQT